MHPNRTFHWSDRAEMLAFVREISFSTIFFSSAEGLRLFHVPVTVASPHRLRFHVSRANRSAPGLDGAEVLLSCIGPDAYISPDWYGTADQVPTWNYLAVECEGVAKRLPQEELVDQLDALSEEHEARLAPKPPWTRHKMTQGRFDAMTRAIIGFELEIRELRGTRKLGQNKKADEIRGAAQALAASGREAMAALMSAEAERR